MDCHQIIESIYRDERITNLINKLDPPELREDLRQEFIMVLFEYDCNKLQQYHREDKLIFFSIRILINMATRVNGYFYRTYRRDEMPKHVEFMRRLQPAKVDIQSAGIAKKKLEQKLLMDANEAHEAIIFEKYTELRSTKKVAEYYGVPRLHVLQVIKKTRNELIKEIKTKK